MRSAALFVCMLIAGLAAIVVAPAAQASGPRLDRGERALVRSINAVRSHHGLARLSPARRLARAADAHSRHMLAADFFSHGAFAQRVRRYVSFRSIGETLAWSSRCSARRFVRMWLRSPGHRAVLLSRSYRRVGVARRTGRLGNRRACLVTADFGSRH